MSNLDFDADDLEFRRQLDPTLSDLRSNIGSCPDPDLLLAAASGATTESAKGAARHLALCPICQDLRRSLMEYEHPGVSIEEDRRIRSRWETDTAPAQRNSGWNWFWKPLPLVVAAALTMAIAIGVWTLRRGVPPPPPVINTVAPQAAQSPAAIPPPARSVLNLEKAAIKVPAAAVLVYRNGRGSDKAFLQALADALQPYRADDYAAAVDRLQALAANYPKAPEAYFYLAVSQLFLNQNEKALESLRTAQPLADESLQDDVSWYLAVALERSGQTQDARREIDGLCSRAGNYKEKACRALAELKSQ